jgi:hypothetical protein
MFAFLAPFFAFGSNPLGKRILAANRPFVAIVHAETIAGLKLPTRLHFYDSVDQDLALAYQVLRLAAGIGKTGSLDSLGQSNVRPM